MLEDFDKNIKPIGGRMIINIENYNYLKENMKKLRSYLYAGKIDNNFFYFKITPLMENIKEKINKIIYSRSSEDNSIETQALKDFSNSENFKKIENIFQILNNRFIKIQKKIENNDHNKGDYWWEQQEIREEESAKMFEERLNKKNKDTE